jgi:hypothetical protein
MRALPDLDNTEAMLLRGKRSAIGAARNEAAQELRDQCTILQGCTWEAVQHHVPQARAALDRLLTLTAMWDELK